MALTVEIGNVQVKDAGSEYKGEMHNVSATLTLKDGEITVFGPQTFSELHKRTVKVGDELAPQEVSATMDRIRVKMTAVKAIVETELALKAIAEEEVATMTSRLQGG